MEEKEVFIFLRREKEVLDQIQTFITSSQKEYKRKYDWVH